MIAESPSLLVASFDRNVAVIGDIHGRSDLLEALLARLPDGMPIVVTGDVGDRGRDARGVVERLVQAGAIGVMGNHDQWLIAWANGRGFDTASLSPMMGGETTLQSFRVVSRTALEIENQRFRVPGPHAQWLAGLAVALDLSVCGQLVGSFTLACLRPRISRICAWRRSSRGWRSTSPIRSSGPPTTRRRCSPLNATIIMGHAIRPRPVDLGHVIAIDTGPGTRPWGALTAVILPERRFVTVRP